jgi:uncharacterized protein (DUF3084 family)
LVVCAARLSEKETELAHAQEDLAFVQEQLHSLRGSMAREARANLHLAQQGFDMQMGAMQGRNQQLTSKWRESVVL